MSETFGINDIKARSIDSNIRRIIEEEQEKLARASYNEYGVSDDAAKVKDIIVFGSVARDEAVVGESDLDLYIEIDLPNKYVETIKNRLESDVRTRIRKLGEQSDYFTKISITYCFLDGCAERKAIERTNYYTDQTVIYRLYPTEAIQIT